MTCKRCFKEVDPVLTPRPDTNNEAEMRCPLCGFFLGWKPKEKNKNKRDGKIKASRLGIDFCHICLRKEYQLGTREVLTVHHIDEDPHNDDELNLLVACNACHNLIHHLRVYYNKHFIDHVNKHHVYAMFKKSLEKFNLPPNIYDRMIREFAEEIGV